MLQRGTGQTGAVPLLIRKVQVRVLPGAPDVQVSVLREWTYILWWQSLSSDGSLESALGAAL